MVTHNTELKFYNDFAGIFTIISISSNRCISIFYEKYSNYILGNPLKNRSNIVMRAAYDKTFKTIAGGGFKPYFQVKYNEISKGLKKKTKTEIQYQIVPPGNHQTNKEEQVIHISNL